MNKKSMNERYYGKASIDSNNQLSDKNFKGLNRNVSSQHASKNTAQMPLILNHNIEGMQKSVEKNPSKIKKIQLKPGMDNSFDNKQVIAMGTPKRSV